MSCLEVEAATMEPDASPFFYDIHWGACLTGACLVGFLMRNLQSNLKLYRGNIFPQRASEYGASVELRH